MDDKERQYREYLALRQQNQERELNNETPRQNDEKFGAYFRENVNKKRNATLKCRPIWQRVMLTDRNEALDQECTPVLKRQKPGSVEESR